MTISSFSAKICSLVILLCCCPALSQTQNQNKPQEPPPNTTVEKTKEEVLRINTSLIQTGIAVFDKKGQFVGNLKQEDFDLRVDGKPVPVSFFEQVSATSQAKNGGDKSNAAPNNAKTGSEVSPSIVAEQRGRTVLFLVDDLHLSPDSLKRTRDLISKFIEREMLPGDLAGIVSTNGKLGFLQQFTNDKAVLRLAVEKLKFSRDNSGMTRFNPPMTEYEALLIDRRDSEMTNIFVNLLAQDAPGTDREILIAEAQSQAHTILIQAAAVSRNTYSILDQAIRNSAQQPGRKIVFLVSDGFLLDIENTDASYQLHLITDAAVRANAVIYSFDAKGLTADLPDATSKINTGIKIDGEPGSGSSTFSLPQKTFTANAYRIQAGERFESQDGLYLLADSTGGRFIHDTNDLQTAMSKALGEASVYYLLAWQPDSENGKSENLRRIEVSVKNRPDLRVSIQKGYLEGNPKATNNVNLATLKKNSEITELPKATKPVLSIAEQQLNDAVTAQTPKSELPTALALNYLDVPNGGATMAAVLKLKSEAVEFTPKDDEATANIDVLGVVFDSTGKRETSFRKLLTVNFSASQLDERQDIYYNYQTKLKPGLYQLRVAARDVKSGRVGSDTQWIEIPDLSSRKLALSSLLLSESAVEEVTPRQVISDSESVLGETNLSVDRRFESSSDLRYLVFIYNAARGQNGLPPDLTIQTQILRGKEVVSTAPANRVSPEGQDAARLPYAAEIPLKTLSSGRYELEVTVQDKIAKTVASQRLSFEIK